jgi:hypothetical protein
MRKTTGFVALGVVVALTAMVVPAQARSGSNTGLGSALPIATDPNASGTKWSGDLTLYFVPQANDNVTTEIFLRVRQGTRLEAYAGSVADVDYNNPYASNSIQAAVSGFVTATVIPALYGCLAGVDCPSWALKSVDQFIEDLQDSPMMFMMMDVVIAVKD